MSEQALAEILKEGNPDKCFAFFKGMPEKRRRSVAQFCRNWFDTIKKENFVETRPGVFSTNPLMAAAEVAVFATATFSELQKVAGHCRPGIDLTYQILIDRRPDWVSDWVLTLLEGPFYWNNWTLIRRLMAAGLVKKPTHPNYYLGMISGMVKWRKEKGHSLKERLLDDRDLLEEDVWRLFEYEGGGENSLANWDRFTHGQTWQEALVTLMKAGHLSRKRLLTHALDALDRDFNHYRAKWFASFYDALEPTREEHAEYACRYLNLLGGSAPPVVSWAFRKVEMLSKSGVYDIGTLIGKLRRVLESRHKGIASKALKLLAQVAHTSPAIARDVAFGSVAALGHEEVDVQHIAIDVVDRFGNTDDEELVSLLADYADIVAPSIRPRLHRWTKRPSANEPATQCTGEKRTTGAALHMNRFDGIDPKLLELYGINSLVENIKNGRFEIPASSFDGMDIRRLDPKQRLSPIEDLDELIDLCARVIEEDSLVDDAERAFDGLARLCDQKPRDFDQRIGPLVKRATQRLKRDMAPFIGIGPADDLCGLVYAWGTGTCIRVQVQHEPGRPHMAHFVIEGSEQRRWFPANMHKALGFLSRRSLALAQRLAEKRPTQLLSAPTHAGGWIDPFVLAHRVNRWSGDVPDHTDVCLALLRMAPDGRATALNELTEVKTEWGRAVRYALGASGIRIGRSPALWIAAARSRSPWTDDQKVMNAFPNLGPDAGVAASYSFQCRTNKNGRTRLIVESEPAPPEKADPDCVTVTLHVQRAIGRGLMSELGGAAGRTVGSVRWTATIWPQARDSFFAAAACNIADNLDWWEAQWQNKALLEPLLDSGTPLRQIGLLLLALALAAKEPGEHGLATDIAIRSIEDGRLGSDNFGRILASLLPTGLVKSGRLFKTLSDIARVSPIHSAVVQQSLQRCLPDCSRQMPRDVGKLLELLKELTIDLNQTISYEPCRAFLAGIKGSEKMRKLAKAMLAVESDAASRNAWQLIDQALNQRLESVHAVSNSSRHGD